MSDTNALREKTKSRVPLAREICDLARNRERAALSERIERGIPQGLADNEGFTPLMLAAQTGCADTVRLLLPVSDPLAANHAGDTALMLAAFRIGDQAFRALLPVSDLTQANAQGQHVWTRSVANQAWAALDALLETGDRGFLAEDKKGRTALSLALENSRFGPRRDAALSFMRDRMSPSEFVALENAGRSPLAKAAARGDTAAIRVLLPVSRQEATDASGRCALDEAFSAASPEAVAILLAAAPPALRARSAARALQSVATAFSGACGVSSAAAALAGSPLGPSLEQRIALCLDLLGGLDEASLAGCEPLLAQALTLMGPAALPRCAARAEARALVGAVARPDAHQGENGAAQEQSPSSAPKPRRI